MYRAAKRPRRSECALHHRIVRKMNYFGNGAHPFLYSILIQDYSGSISSSASVDSVQHLLYALKVIGEACLTQSCVVKETLMWMVDNHDSSSEWIAREYGWTGERCEDAKATPLLCVLKRLKEAGSASAVWLIDTIITLAGTTKEVLDEQKFFEDCENNEERDWVVGSIIESFAGIDIEVDADDAGRPFSIGTELQRLDQELMNQLIPKLEAKYYHLVGKKVKDPCTVPCLYPFFNSLTGQLSLRWEDKEEGGGVNYKSCTLSKPTVVCEDGSERPIRPEEMNLIAFEGSEIVLQSSRMYCAPAGAYRVATRSFSNAQLWTAIADYERRSRLRSRTLDSKLDTTNLVFKGLLRERDGTFQLQWGTR